MCILLGLLAKIKCSIFEVAKFMHDISHNKLQQSFQSMFSLVKERHNRITRQTTDNKFSLPLVQTNYGKRFITFFGVKAWNNIPNDIRYTLHTHTVSTRKFDLNEVRKIVVCVWQFFVDHELQIAITGAFHLETECFWHFVSGGGVLFSLASGLGLELLPQNTIFTPKCPTMELSHIIFAEIPPYTFTPSAVIKLTYFLFCFCSP